MPNIWVLHKPKQLLMALFPQNLQHGLLDRSWQLSVIITAKLGPLETASKLTPSAVQLCSHFNILIKNQPQLQITEMKTSHPDINTNAEKKAE